MHHNIHKPHIRELSVNWMSWWMKDKVVTVQANYTLSDVILWAHNNDDTFIIVYY